MRPLHPYINARTKPLLGRKRPASEKEIPADSIQFAARQGGVLLFQLPAALEFLLNTLNSAFLREKINLRQEMIDKDTFFNA